MTTLNNSARSLSHPSILFHCCNLPCGSTMESSTIPFYTSFPTGPSWAQLTLQSHSFIQHVVSSNVFWICVSVYKVSSYQQFGRQLFSRSNSSAVVSNLSFTILFHLFNTVLSVLDFVLGCSCFDLAVTQYSKVIHLVLEIGLPITKEKNNREKLDSTGTWKLGGKSDSTGRWKFRSYR